METDNNETRIFSDANRRCTEYSFTIFFNVKSRDYYGFLFILRFFFLQSSNKQLKMGEENIRTYTIITIVCTIHMKREIECEKNWTLSYCVKFGNGLGWFFKFIYITQTINIFQKSLLLHYLENRLKLNKIHPNPILLSHIYNFISCLIYFLYIKYITRWSRAELSCNLHWRRLEKWNNSYDFFCTLEVERRLYATLNIRQ